VLTKDSDHTLHELMQSSIRVFCLLKYLSTMSRELERIMNGSNIISADIALEHNSTVFWLVFHFGAAEKCSLIDINN